LPTISRMTIHEFARRIGVSTATIWRAINNERGIRSETRSMVLRRMEELGYEPNRAARALVTGRSHMILLWMASLPNPYDAMVIHHVQQQVVGHDFDMIVRDVRPERPTTAASLRQWPVDGILVVDATETVRRLLRTSRHLRTPLVSMGAYHEESIDSVGVDLYAGSRAAVEHLIAIGCKRVAYLVPEYFNLEGDARRTAYLELVNEAGITPEIIKTDLSCRAAAIQAVRAYGEKHGYPDGIFCFNDDHAIGAYRGLREAGIRVPEDVALVGCDGIEDTEYLERPISTIVQPIEEMCSLAWQFLERRMKKRGIPRQHALLRPRLVVRASSRR